MRYVLPVVPTAILCACFLLRAVATLPYAWAPRVAAVVAVAVLAGAAQRAVRLVAVLEGDSRVAAERWLTEHGARPLVELYASRQTPDVLSAVTIDLNEARGRGITHVVTTSFLFERLAVGATLPDQPAHVYALHDRYQQLFRLPSVEILPRYMSVAFSDPTIRIVDIR